LHHKTGATVWHPLEKAIGGVTVQFYPEAETVLAKLPRIGVPMILREVKSANGIAFKPYSYSGFEKIVQQLREDLGLTPYFTLDACRHGGMTELEEAALTEGQGRALSAQNSAGVPWLRQRNLRPRVIGHTQASRSSIGERTSDKRSERRAD
jgi:hypothetical protein